MHFCYLLRFCRESFSLRHLRTCSGFLKISDQYQNAERECTQKQCRIKVCVKMEYVSHKQRIGVMDRTRVWLIIDAVYNSDTMM